ncbi:hypothetical protein GLYMA_13G041950v4 [Glycine max]|nr:hypothetical protein GLYMA_13G041950v4 [Glycine max]KAH1099749.1 hypothetical protein GYH30_035093 [Glycine max]
MSSLASFNVIIVVVAGISPSLSLSGDDTNYYKLYFILQN